MRAAAALGRRQVLVLGAVATAATLALSGCAAGQQAQTAEQTSVVDGTGFQVGDLAIRDLGVRAPSNLSYQAGQDAYLEGVITNNGQTSDQLVSVSSTDATSAAFFPDGVSAVTALGASSSASGSSGSSSGGASSSSGASASSSAGVSASPSAGASASASATDTNSGAASSASSSAEASQLPTAGEAKSSPAGSSAPTGTSSAPAAEAGALQNLPAEAGQAVQVGYSDDQVQIVLLGLKRDLAPAQTLQVTFVFAKAGPITATIAVKLVQDQTQSAPSIDTGREGE